MDWGGGGVKNLEFFMDVFYGWPLSLCVWAHFHQKTRSKKVLNELGKKPLGTFNFP